MFAECYLLLSLASMLPTLAQRVGNEIFHRAEGAERDAAEAALPQTAPHSLT